MAFLSQYNPLQRFQITLGAVLLLALVAYFFSIRNTLQIKKILKSQQLQLSIVENAPQQIAQLKNQMNYLDSHLSSQPYKRNTLFSEISQFCENNQLVLKEFGNEIFLEKEQLKYITNPIKVSGSFQNIVRLIYHLEQVAQNGYLVHSNIEMFRKTRSKKKELTAEIHIQHLVLTKK